VDADFDMMVEKFRLTAHNAQPHSKYNNSKISICVRKRPIFSKEEAAGEIDSVSAANPVVRVHDFKLRVDGITKYVENHNFVVDHAFSELETNDELYEATIQPNIHFPFNKGIVTCFAYG
jgi:kinesin family member 2/24